MTEQRTPVTKSARQSRIGELIAREPVRTSAHAGLVPGIAAQCHEREGAVREEARHADVATGPLPGRLQDRPR